MKNPLSRTIQRLPGYFVLGLLYARAFVKVFLFEHPKRRAS